MMKNAGYRGYLSLEPHLLEFTVVRSRKRYRRGRCKTNVNKLSERNSLSLLGKARGRDIGQRKIKANYYLR